MQLRAFAAASLKRIFSHLRTLVWGFNRRDVSLVGDEDLFALLKETGQLESIQNGDARCSICGKPVSTDSLAAIVANDGQWALVCDDQLCLEEHKSSDQKP